MIKLLFLFLLSFFSVCAEDYCLKAPFDHDWIKKRYKKRAEKDPINICIVVHNFGMQKFIAKKILHILPSKVCVSITPYPENLESLIEKINVDGHDLLFVQPVSFYRNTSSPVDPYRIDTHNVEANNNAVFQKTLSKMPKETVAIIVEESSPVLKDDQVLGVILPQLKEKKVPIVSPEIALDDDFRAICQKNGVTCFEADYYIDKNKKYEEITGLLERALALATTTGNLLLVVDAHIFNVKEVLEWFQKIKNETTKLISFHEYVALFEEKPQ